MEYGRVAVDEDAVVAELKKVLEQIVQDLQDRFENKLQVNELRGDSDGPGAYRLYFTISENWKERVLGIFPKRSGNILARFDPSLYVISYNIYDKSIREEVESGMERLSEILQQQDLTMQIRT